MRWNHLVRVATAATMVALLSGVAAVPVAAAPTAGVATRYVDDDGRADSVHGCAGAGMAFEEIQLAIDDSNENDVVKVCPGVYREQLTIENRAGLVLEAARPWKTTLKPPLNTDATDTAGDFYPAVVNVLSNRVVVRWLSLVIPATGGCDFDWNGIIVDGAEHVQIRSNRFSGGAGDPTVCGLADPIIYTNGASGLAAFNRLTRFFDTGILVDSGSDVSVNRNSLRFFKQDLCIATSRACTAVTPQFTYGIHVDDGSSARVRHNVLKEQPETGEIDVRTIGIEVSDSTAAVEQNRIRGLFYGVEFYGGSGAIRSNLVTGGNNAGIRIVAASSIAIARNTVTGRGITSIYLDPDTTGNNIHDNDFRGSHGIDCVDQSSGPANTWTNNLGNSSDPSGLCESAP